MAERGVKYHDHGTYYTCTVDGGVERCVACNRPLEYGKHGCEYLCKHECPPAVVRGKESASTRLEEGHHLLERKKTYYQRLRDGFDASRQAQYGPEDKYSFWEALNIRVKL